MGAGIAQVAAQAGHAVKIIDMNGPACEKALSSINKSIMRVAKKKHAEDQGAQDLFVGKVMGNVSATTDTEDGVKDADLVIEAIVENLEVKQKLFQKLDGWAPKHTMFASNTSSLPIRDICATVSADRRKLFGGLHFFNPVAVMKLCEVVRSDETSDETMEKLTKFGKEIGKTTVAASDTPGFIVNRLLVPYLFEAYRMVERGDATIEDIDTAMKLGAGHPMGPFALSDYIGLDTNKSIIDGWAKAFPEETLFRPSPVLDEKVEEGKLGCKTKEGFFKY